MEYKKIGETYYLRFDKGDEIISGIKAMCCREGIAGAIYSGIGGCSDAAIQTFFPAKGAFVTDTVEGMLELVCFNGNIAADENGALQTHTHALFAYLKDGEHQVIGGHLKSTTVLYTAEIELRPIVGGAIHLKPDKETGTGFWAF